MENIPHILKKKGQVSIENGLGMLYLFQQTLLE